MKKCVRCNKEKPLNEFGKCKNHKDGLNYSCKECKRKYDNLYYNAKTKLKKKEKYNKQRERIKIIQNFILNYLKNQKCNNCGETRIPVLDFHHTKDKKFNVSDGVKKGYSLNKIKKEIEKCKILCANCHRVETAKDYNWYSNII